MNHDLVSRWLSQCRGPLAIDVVEPTHESTARHGGSNVSSFRSRTFPARLRPSSTAQVQSIIRCMPSEAPGLSVYPLSTGRNWGLGSSEPVDDGSAVLELGKMDAIRLLDATTGVAVVEPGVTQGALAKRLEGTPWMLNVTASSAHTSVVGNAMERGVGLRRQRTEDIIGLEVVLADGTLVHVGAWPGDGNSTPYAHGLGPGLLPLFLQSNLGVVTAAAVQLIHRPEVIRIASLHFTQENLEVAVDELRRIYTRGLAQGVLKVYSPAAVTAYGGRSERQYTAYICTNGTSRVVGAALADIEDAVRASGSLYDFRCLRPADTVSDVVADAVLHAYAGDPGRNDAMLEASLGVPAARVDQDSDQGWLFFLPMLPFTGEAVSRARKLLDRVTAETGVDCGMTINGITTELVDLVVTIRFLRTAENTAGAHQALDLLYESFPVNGFLPYRVDIDHMRQVPDLRRDQSQSDLLHRLKSTLDPNHLIAPGRYPSSRGSDPEGCHRNDI
ncbi:FAD-dependent oxidoreductase [Streptomyces sp. NPDC051657]|uniref:FAD-binding oxidoreductase n=1 Tax=unclassified Streptomyces TaxID=2593676 RepID=UPI00343AE2F9